ncbi:unnamed protein product [Somion occarium]|uniref:GPI ethanolamine phosphate transferase 2 C-terminal domain-containing protein n=2 Tax=Somion occarium TaxID=3059160 RepID=A0ABP1D707_9APHY
MWSRGAQFICWVFAVHLIGIWLFTRGFLLTRLALSEVNSCDVSDPNCTLSPSYKRMVFLIIDALRFDFISPDPPLPSSPYYHNVLSLPAELTKAQPDRSIIYYAFPDPPTTTLQRIKGITTGSLPTFVDMGSNFGGSSILEDSLIRQLYEAGKQIAFMGDDTWMSVFPTSFAPNMTFPYDSFNVEDLHSVDEGVIRHLLPLLHHVGHRLGPDHPTMQAKLQQMDNVLRETVELLDDDTLLVLLGDHGMDRKGDHGGDGELETSAGLWLYSKTRPLVDPQADIPAHLLTNRTYPGASTAHRSVQQIDLVPSLSLLLGLPIPFNNLGTVIPELFWTGKQATSFEHALRTNAAQVKRYLDAYRLSPAGSELDSAWKDIQSAWQGAMEGQVPALTMNMFTRYALEACRMLWAQFNITLIGLGLTTLLSSSLATFAVYDSLGRIVQWEPWLDRIASMTLRWSGIGTVSGLVVAFPLRPYVKDVAIFDYVAFGAAIASSFAVIKQALPARRLEIGSISSIPLPLVLHTLSFMSNSYTFWEDHVIPYLLLTSIAPFVLTGFTAPTPRLRTRILFFSSLFAVCVRLIAISTVCREEQQPYCHVTFFSGSTITTPPGLILAIVVPIAFGLPSAIRQYLKISKSDQGLANILLPTIFPSVLTSSSFVWILEWMESSEVLGPSCSGALRLTRTTLAWLSIGTILVVALTLWWLIPLCIKVETSEPAANERREVTIIGFANALGSPYLIFWLIFFSLVFTTTQLAGQVILALATVALLSFLEVVDSVRDVRALNLAFSSSKPSEFLAQSQETRSTLSTVGLRFSEVTPIALLALQVFFGTGHQAVISTIQWKSAFILTSSLTYPLSPLLVILNSLGPVFVFALAVPLIATWNTPPLPYPPSTAQNATLRACLGISLYFTSLLLGSAISSAWLRRHLMVWKVFAPRFMLAALCLVAVDVAVIVGYVIGFGRISVAVGRVFGSMPGANDAAKARKSQ